MQRTKKNVTGHVWDGPAANHDPASPARGEDNGAPGEVWMEESWEKYGKNKENHGKRLEKPGIISRDLMGYIYIYLIGCNGM